MSTPREERRELGAGAVFSEAEAVRLLPVRDAVAREWLRSSGLVHEHPKLGRVVVWGEVLAALRTPEAPAPAKAAALPRAGVYQRKRR